jgi:hypothetical protein
VARLRAGTGFATATKPEETGALPIAFGFQQFIAGTAAPEASFDKCVSGLVFALVWHKRGEYIGARIVALD